MIVFEMLAPVVAKQDTFHKYMNENERSKAKTMEIIDEAISNVKR